MTRDLLILRHGETKLNHPNGDFARELKNKGKRRAQRLGVWLDEHDLKPDFILTSPAERAHTTAHKCCKSAGLGTKIIQEERSLYNAAPIEVMSEISKISDDVQRLMVVGHNPGLSMLVANLSQKYVPMDPGMLVLLRFEGSWRDLSHADCIQVISPHSLPKTFPFVTAEGKTQERVRPAYYYRQSCVVPYRMMQNGEPEILIISSSAHKHWVVPKGIHEPGMSARESAAQEALEEAGIKGKVHDHELGRYSYEKWQATCTVSVYPMEVTDELSKEEWEESHRLRRWVSLPSALELIGNEKLAAVVEKLHAYLAEKRA
ncbi:Phosphoglycerate/bisphosphoglycerate family mutase [Candidatus Terasakiella magnetica]|uniref:Phosphoglycerate/bisphosphoglycerate family mutase n=1 Tax=Candidatus Terasakiella magnetica TaxID=1867952 RepID=A0A1C3RHB6_9PROT|nr:histidine phosphatase family protein [Candidatus Terasakiella magnetica]SCA56594.1 Phosphoglycerate/bisphosphoglycerate family mutase [Candidatus Terasakiella magnetica]